MKLSVVAETKPAPSETIAAEIETLERQKSGAEAEVSALAAAYDAAILKGDSAAEKNERETTIAKRTIRRCELRIAELERDLTESKEREAEEAAEIKRAEARRAVDAVLAKLDDGYRGPANQIVEFLKEWQTAEALAEAAGIETLHTRLRYKPERRIGERKRTITVFIDENGDETNQEYPVGSYRTDALGRKLDPNYGSRDVLMPSRPTREKIVTDPQQVEPGWSASLLPANVSLPGLTWDEAPFWKADDLTSKKK